MLALARIAADDGLVICWEVQPENAGAQRFYRRLGAGLFTKVIAGWRPESYLGLLLPETGEAATAA
ncbi:hypothetical protein A6A27_32670 [Micromonospora sp. CB01531]|nr:hypothetical protein [Micromonospora sp. CB01531]OKI53559.1 hypothetical protein A6A27_32670 [Micromonospora sp. CB01531]